MGYERFILNKRFFSKIFSILLFIAFVATVFLFPNWYLTQVNKVRGMYLVWKGDRALRKLEIQKAIGYYLNGLELYPGHYGAWFNLGNIYVLYEDYYSAADAYENAIKYNPNYVIARMNYGIISAERLGDFDGAIDQYNTILGIRRKLVYIPYVFNNLKSYKTNIGLAYYNMGVAYRQKSIYEENARGYQEELNLKKSISYYKEAIKILKDNYDAYYNLALAFHLYGDLRSAGLAYCKAIEIEPLNYDAHYNLALLLRELKFYKEAIVEMQKATLLITENDGSSYRQQYVFQVLNDISRRFMETKGKINYIVENENENESTMEAAANSINFDTGHFTLDSDFDKSMYKNFKKCGSMKLFVEEGTDVDDILTRETF